MRPFLAVSIQYIMESCGGNGNGTSSAPLSTGLFTCENLSLTFRRYRLIRIIAIGDNGKLPIVGIRHYR